MKHCGWLFSEKLDTVQRRRLVWRLNLENIQDYKHHLESLRFMQNNPKNPNKTKKHPKLKSHKKTNRSQKRKQLRIIKIRWRSFLLVRRQHYWCIHTSTFTYKLYIFLVTLWFSLKQTIVSFVIQETDLHLFLKNC